MWNASFFIRSQTMTWSFIGKRCQECYNAFPWFQVCYCWHEDASSVYDRFTAGTCTAGVHYSKDSSRWNQAGMIREIKLCHISYCPILIWNSKSCDDIYRKYDSLWNMEYTFCLFLQEYWAHKKAVFITKLLVSLQRKV